VFSAIAELKKDGLCVLLVEQLIDNSLAVSDQVAVLDHGKLVLNQRVSSLRDWDVLREVYLGAASSSPHSPAEKGK
jgi:branched-chain amino acid transport system ATP-binding protein